MEFKLALIVLLGAVMVIKAQSFGSMMNMFGSSSGRGRPNIGGPFGGSGSDSSSRSNMRNPFSSQSGMGSGMHGGMKNPFGGSGKNNGMINPYSRGGMQSGMGGPYGGSGMHGGMKNPFSGSDMKNGMKNPFGGSGMGPNMGGRRPEPYMSSRPGGNMGGRYGSHGPMPHKGGSWPGGRHGSRYMSSNDPVQTLMANVKSLITKVSGELMENPENYEEILSKNVEEVSNLVNHIFAEDGMAGQVKNIFSEVVTNLTNANSFDAERILSMYENVSQKAEGWYNSMKNDAESMRTVPELTKMVKMHGLIAVAKLAGFLTPTSIETSSNGMQMCMCL